MCIRDSSMGCTTLQHIALACLHRTPIEHICTSTRVELQSKSHQYCCCARCTLHTAAQSNGAATRPDCCHLHGCHGPRRQQAMGRRTIREQAAARAARPRRVRALRNDPDAVERHGRTATRVVQRLDACGRGDGVPADATPSETRAIDATFSTHRSTTPCTTSTSTTPSTCTSPAAACRTT